MMSTLRKPLERVASIDLFRALTMFAMVFVNDQETLTNVPVWLTHAAKEEDRLGLADIVFPVFLFIVGLSIPLAIRGRLSRGITRTDTFVHICTRSFALLIMGIFLVNLESYDPAAALLPRAVWQIGIVCSFFLIWLDYPRYQTVTKTWLLRACGVLLLALLAVLFRGGGRNEDGVLLSTSGIRPHWYGILGLIGWSYLLCATLFLLSKDRLSVTVPAFFFFLGFSIADKTAWLPFPRQWRDQLWIVSSGALPAITMAGIVCFQLFQRAGDGTRRRSGMLLLAGLAIVLLVAGEMLRAYWNISKIRTSPPWVLICIAISTGCFLLAVELFDIRGKTAWLKELKPAGTSTLTCYLLPFIHYALLSMAGERFLLPEWLRTGYIGVFKSLLYAGLIVWITGWLERRRIRLTV